MKRDNIFRQKQAPVNGRSLKLTTENFFKEDNPNGYLSKEGLMTHVEGFEENEPQQFMDAFEQMRQGKRLKYNPTIQTHQKNGAKYLWLEFQYPRGTRGFKVVINDDLLRLIEDYVMGKVSIHFTIEDLVDVALNG